MRNWSRFEKRVLGERDRSEGGTIKWIGIGDGKKRKTISLGDQESPP
jgi:hypothetical protein